MQPLSVQGFRFRARGFRALDLVEMCSSSVVTPEPNCCHGQDSEADVR